MRARGREGRGGEEEGERWERDGRGMEGKRGSEGEREKGKDGEKERGIVGEGAGRDRERARREEE